MKNLGALILVFLALFVVPIANTQVKKRTAVLRWGSSFPQAEQTIADQLVTMLVDDGRVEVVDRDKLAQIMNEQNMQNNLYYDPRQPRFSADSAVYLGKLLGVPALVFVRVDAYSGALRVANNGKKHTTYGSVVLKTTAQLVNVETGSIFGAPTASYDQERVVSESTDGRPPRSYGPVPIPGEKGIQGPDPKVGWNKMTTEAFDLVEHELAAKVASTLAAAPIQRVPTQPQKIPKVAGVQNGMTFINAGTNAGLKAGDTFQIIRMVDSGMQDPDSHQAILRKKQVCLLTISEVEDSLAYGKCVGDLALSGDQAIAQNH